MGLRFKEIFPKNSTPTSSSPTTSSNNLPTIIRFNNDNHSRGNRGGNINIRDAYYPHIFETQEKGDRTDFLNHISLSQNVF